MNNKQYSIMDIRFHKIRKEKSVYQKLYLPHYDTGDTQDVADFQGPNTGIWGAPKPVHIQGFPYLLSLYW